MRKKHFLLQHRFLTRCNQSCSRVMPPLWRAMMVNTGIFSLAGKRQKAFLELILSLGVFILLGLKIRYFVPFRSSTLLVIIWLTLLNLSYFVYEIRGKLCYFLSHIKSLLTIWHKTLIFKLSSYDFSHSLYNFISSFLSDCSIGAFGRRPLF